MARPCDEGCLIDQPTLARFGLTTEMIRTAITFVHETLDMIDGPLLEKGGRRLADLLELANLSAIIGNLFRVGIVSASHGNFAVNRPHTYPDLLAVAEGCKDIEIKVALEGNQPKGHLAKPGPHLTLRYVLGGADGSFLRGKENRGSVAWGWEVREGSLLKKHFRISNPKGDSGKTAVVGAQGMSALKFVYGDLTLCPLSDRNAARASIAALVRRD